MLPATGLRERLRYQGLCLRQRCEGECPTGGLAAATKKGLCLLQQRCGKYRGGAGLTAAWMGERKYQRPGRVLPLEVFQCMPGEFSEANDYLGVGDGQYVRKVALRAMRCCGCHTSLCMGAAMDQCCQGVVYPWHGIFAAIQLFCAFSDALPERRCFPAKLALCVWCKRKMFFKVSAAIKTGDLHVTLTRERGVAGEVSGYMTDEKQQRGVLDVSAPWFGHANFIRTGRNGKALL